MLKNLLFTELAFELEGEGRLLELAQQRAVLGEKHHPGQLLGNGAGPLFHRTTGEVCDHCPANAHGINPVVLVKTPIFRSNKSPLHQQWHLAIGHLFAGGGAEFLQHLAIGRKHRHRAWPAEGADPSGIGQRAIKALDQGRAAGGGQGAGSSRQQGSQQQFFAAPGGLGGWGLGWGQGQRFSPGGETFRET